MTEEEALIRAREAVIAVRGLVHKDNMQRFRDGEYDINPNVQAAKRALLDLDKPLPVDRDLADLRELAAAILPYAIDDDITRLSRRMLPTFRTIIQRRIDEAGK